MGKIQAAIWKCNYCKVESIHIGTDSGSSGTHCKNGCPGRFTFVKEYPLATNLTGIKDAFIEVENSEE